jgi:parallel beta-helix repeat protein
MDISWPEGDCDCCIDATGTYFEVTNSNYLDITLTSSEIVHVHLESVPKVVDIHIEPECTATTTQITLSGFEASKIYYRYQDGDLTEEFTTDSTGSYSYTQDISTNHHVFIQEEESTIYIYSDGSVTPGAPINVVDDTYTLTDNVYESIFIQKPGITLDGGGYSLQSMGDYYGLYVNSISGVTLQNLNIDGFVQSIVLYDSSSNTIIGNTISTNKFSNKGINVIGSHLNTIQDNSYTAIPDSHSAIIIDNSNENTISGNTLSTGYGLCSIDFKVSDNNILSYNTVSGYSNGIQLGSSSGNTINSNTLSGPSGGIGLINSDSNSIYENTINYRVGMRLSYSDSNQISSNSFTVVSVGIDTYNSDMNTLNSNIISSDTFGIMIYPTVIGQNIVNGNDITSLSTCLYIKTSRESTVTNNILYGRGGVSVAYSELCDISGNTITGTSPHRSGIYVNDCPGTTITANTATTSQMGVLSSSIDVTISGNTLSANGFGVKLGATNNLVTGNILTSNGYGVGISGSESFFSHTNTIRSNTITDSLYHGITMSWGENNIFTENTISSSVGAGFSILQSQNNKITHNIVSENGAGVSLWGGDYNEEVTDNILSNNDIGIFLRHVDAHTIMRNTITGSVDRGMYLHASNYLSIIDNTISNSGDYGIHLGGSYNTISDNFVSGNIKGIYISGPTNTIENNIISDNTDSGLYLNGVGYTIKGNIIINNNYGIYSHGGGSHIIHENIISSSPSHGLYFIYSTNNLVYHNDIVKNGISAYDTGPAANDWHHPVLLEGNYWSDYEGEDDGTGTGKHAIIGDGIGDTLIAHPATDYDFYPFTTWFFNGPPEIISLTGPEDPVPVDTTFTMTATFTDPDLGDTHTATWNWGDGSTSDGTVDQDQDKVTDEYVYSTPGVYQITLTVIDFFGESDTMTWTQYMVVYDPEGSFVTGGGMIDSPPGAFPDDLLLTGKAGFGFVSKYQKGQTTPGGNTQFRFHAGDISFHSTSYDWLIVAGQKAMFKGSGEVNGEGNYGFLISAIDGDIPGAHDEDLFRIKIWDKDNFDTVIYDNGMGDADDADPGTPLTHGSIKIHK